MQNNFNEFNPTIGNLKSGLFEVNLFSQNILEDDKHKTLPNYKCSLIEIPEVDDSATFLSYFRGNEDSQLAEFFKKQRNASNLCSGNSIFNLDNSSKPFNFPSRQAGFNSTENQTENDAALIFHNLWISQKNIFENENNTDSLFFGAKTPKEIRFIDKPEPKKKEREACNCKKSKCLRLYCECFAKGLVCGVDCACDGCHNTEDSQELRELVVQETLQKNPFAFKSKYKTIKEEETLLHSRGCNCSKTGCVKKYCECFNAGTGCSRLCKCSNCKNENIELKDSDVRVYYDRVLRKRSKNSAFNLGFSKKKNILNRVKMI